MSPAKNGVRATSPRADGSTKLAKEEKGGDVGVMGLARELSRKVTRAAAESAAEGTASLVSIFVYSC